MSLAEPKVLKLQKQEVSNLQLDAVAQGVSGEEVVEWSTVLELGQGQ